MSDYRRMKVTNSATGQFVGYLGKAGLLHNMRPQKLYCVLEQPADWAGEITWAMKDSDVTNVTVPGKRPASAEEWARHGYAYLAIKNHIWDIAGEQLWLDRGHDKEDWAMWSWTSSYARVQWNANNTISAMPGGDVMLYVDKCDSTNWWYLRWGKGANNPSVARLDFE